MEGWLSAEDESETKNREKEAPDRIKIAGLLPVVKKNLLISMTKVYRGFPTSELTSTAAHHVMSLCLT